MSARLNIVIDGKNCECEKGEYLLEVCKRNGIYVPTLCHHPGMEGIASCRVCIVEVVERERHRIVTSCIFPIEREIEVFTQSETIKEQRGVILSLLHHLAPNAKVIADMARFTGVELCGLADKADGNKCILCGRCTIACEALGSGAIARVGRGTEKAVATPYSEPSAECIGCGSCASVCPTGEIAATAAEDSFTIWGKEFPLLHCDACGTAMGTAEQYAHARSKAKANAQEPASDAVLCNECERKAVATLLKDSARVERAVRA